jgi:muramidase (phage lysozyme)
MTPNERAFLTMLATSEGTEGKGDRGYNVLVGGKLFDGYTDHPRITVRLSDKLSSTAAGRYQILARVYDSYRAQLHLPDFSPPSQDAIAIQLIRECRALPMIAAGRIRDAINACSSRWSSLPGAGYGQHENSVNDLVRVYQRAGGVVA